MSAREKEQKEALQKMRSSMATVDHLQAVLRQQEELLVINDYYKDRVYLLESAVSKIHGAATSHQPIDNTTTNATSAYHLV